MFRFNPISRNRIVAAGLFGIVALHQPLSMAQAPDAAAPAVVVKTGEIQFTGKVSAVNAAEKSFTLSVQSFTLPGGKTSRLAAPKPKAVSIDAASLIQSADGKPFSLANLTAGGQVIVIGADLGTGKPLPARLVVVQSAPAAPAAAGGATASGSKIEIRPGEIRVDGNIEGILAANSFQLSATATTASSGRTTELEDRESWSVQHNDKTAIRARVATDRQFTPADLTLRLRVAVVGQPLRGDEKGIRAREIILLDESITNVSSLGTVEISAEVSDLLGKSDQFRNEGLYDKALQVAQQALKSGQLSGDGPGQALALNRQGMLYRTINQPQRAQQSFEQAVAIWRQLRRPERVGAPLIGLASILHEGGNTQKAIEMLEEALPALNNEVAARASMLNHLGSMYAHTDKPQEALNRFQQALPLLRQLGDKDRELDVRIQVVDLLLDTDQDARALELAEQIAPAIAALTNKSEKAMALLTVSRAYHSNDKSPVALQQLREALKLFVELGSKEGQEAAQHAIDTIEKPAAGGNGAAQGGAAQNGAAVQ